MTATSGSVVATTDGDTWQIRSLSGEQNSDQQRQTAQAQTSSKDHQASSQAQVVESTQDTTKINVNTATQSALMSLPRIGEKLSERIMRARDEARFSSVDELRRRIRGIGPKSAKTLAPLISF